MGSSGAHDPASNIATTLSKQMSAAVANINAIQRFIVITEDRTRLCLMEWQGGIERRIETHGKWIAPLSLVASIGFTLATSTFHEAFGMSKDVWQALAILALIASAGWLIRSIYFRVRAAMGKPSSIDTLIDSLKKGGEEIGTPPASPQTATPAVR